MSFDHPTSSNKGMVILYDFVLSIGSLFNHSWILMILGLTSVSRPMVTGASAWIPKSRKRFSASWAVEPHSAEWKSAKHGLMNEDKLHVFSYRFWKFENSGLYSQCIATWIGKLMINRWILRCFKIDIKQTRVCEGVEAQGPWPWKNHNAMAIGKNCLVDSVKNSFHDIRTSLNWGDFPCFRIISWPRPALTTAPWPQPWSHRAPRSRAHRPTDPLRGQRPVRRRSPAAPGGRTSRSSAAAAWRSPWSPWSPRDEAGELSDIGLPRYTSERKTNIL